LELKPHITYFGLLISDSEFDAGTSTQPTVPESELMTPNGSLPVNNNERSSESLDIHSSGDFQPLEDSGIDSVTHKILHRLGSL
jgi:hypothetical protein